MKSIKEKASEYSFVNKGIDETGNYYEDYSVVKLDGFIAGANYVLEQIEDSLQEFSNYEDSIIISRIIEQLKK